MDLSTRSMTNISQIACRAATVNMHSVEEAVDFLEHHLITRNVRSILEKFSGGRDLKALQKLLVDDLLTDDPEQNRGSVERRVRGWLSPNNVHTIRKQDAIEIAFILQLELEEADELLALISEEKFHWRNMDEIIFIYGLIHKLSYRACMEIRNQPEIQEVLQKVSDYLPDDRLEEDCYTEFIQKEVCKLGTPQELTRYLCENYRRLGAFHNTAFDMFREMLLKLSASDPFDETFLPPDEEELAGKYTIRDILSEYLYKNIVLTARQMAVLSKKKAKQDDMLKKLPEEKQYTLSIIQKKIADSWPDEFMLSRMKNRKTDVTRKTLILLFLATDGDYSSYDYEDEEDEQEDVFEDILERLDDMLFFCGYASLDPRNPFDWLILYCIYVQDLFDIDPRMKELLSTLFGIDPDRDESEE